jgi:hypothetical protein
MYVGAIHEITNPETAFPRGEKLMRGEGAPDGTRVLQFYPASDGSKVLCLWESETVADVQGYVDDVLGDAAHNTSFEINSDQAFSERPLGLPVSLTTEA